MDVSEFQKKLEEICNVAEENNKKLTTDQVREHFQKSDLDKSQLLKILQYLKIKGISIEGAGDVKVESTEQETVQDCLSLWASQLLACLRIRPKKPLTGFLSILCGSR